MKANDVTRMLHFQLIPLSDSPALRLRKRSSGKGGIVERGAVSFDVETAGARYVCKQFVIRIYRVEFGIYLWQQSGRSCWFWMKCDCSLG